MFETHLSLSLSKGWFVFSFSSLGFKKKIWGLVGWFFVLSVLFQKIEKKLKEKEKLFDFFRNFFNSHLFWLNSHPFFACPIICRLNLSVSAPTPPDV